MGGGGVSPFEWILPPVAIAHHAYNASAQAAGAGKAKLNVPTSANEQEESARNEQQRNAQTSRDAEAIYAAKSAAEYLAANPLPQTPEEELASRRRAQAAGASRLGGKRPSQYLAGGEATLGNTV
jgi:hypothetical protein